MFRFLSTFTAFCDGHDEDQKKIVTSAASSYMEVATTKKKKKKSLPEDPLDCKNPVCGDKLSFFKQALESQKNQAKGQSQTKVTETDVASSSSLKSEQEHNTTKANELECPLDRDELGRSTWNFLHTMAAYYPDKPSQEEELAAKNLIEALALLYPCKHCAGEFQVTIEESKPRFKAIFCYFYSC
jgi:hypothetical protein